MLLPIWLMSHVHRAAAHLLAGYTPPADVPCAHEITHTASVSCSPLSLTRLPLPSPSTSPPPPCPSQVHIRRQGRTPRLSCHPRIGRRLAHYGRHRRNRCGARVNISEAQGPGLHAGATSPHLTPAPHLTHPLTLLVTLTYHSDSHLTYHIPITPHRSLLPQGQGDSAAAASLPRRPAHKQL